MADHPSADFYYSKDSPMENLFYLTPSIKQMLNMIGKVAIILVVTNEKQKIEKLYYSLLKQTYKNIRIYFVDNNSKDGSQGYSKEINNKLQLDIKYISLKENSGFAKGNNIGAERAIQDGCNYVFILNPDMELNKICIEELLKLINKENNIGVVGPLLLFGNEEKNENKIQLFGSTTDFKSQKKHSLFANEKLSDVNLPDYLLVDFVNGGSTFVKKEVIEKIGLFEEKYFIYNDEIDFAYRVKKSGYKTYVSSKAKVWHHHEWSKKSKQSYYFMYYYMMRNRYLYYYKFRLYTNLFADIIKQIMFFPIKIRWANRTTGIRLLRFYYLGIIHGLQKKTGKAKVNFD